jgi:hypothetical protein
MPLTSKTDICNLALAELGARRITSYESDTTVEAKACRLHLDHVIDTLLERHQWNHATKHDTLSKLSTVPNPEWTEAYQLPSDFIRLIRVSVGSSLNSLQNFALEGRNILTIGEGDTLPIVYVSNDIPVAQWSPLFIDAVVYKLAAKIAGDVTQNPSLADGALNKLESLALPVAQTADARQTLSGENFGPAHMAAQSPLVRARYNTGGIASYAPTPAP